MNTKTFFRVSIGILGLCLMQSPRFSEGARANESVQFINGASQSSNVEISDSLATMFGQGAVNVQPVLTGNLSFNATSIDYLEVSPGPLTVVPSDSSFAASALNSSFSLSDVVLIIRVDSGTTGLE